MGRTIKVKVPVSRLLDSARAQRAKIIAAHEKELAKADRLRERWEDKALTALHNTIDAIHQHTLDMSTVDDVWRTSNRSKITVEVKCARPNVDAKPDTWRIDKDIALLEAASDTELSIGTDDNFGRYL